MCQWLACDHIQRQWHALANLSQRWRAIRHETKVTSDHANRKTVEVAKRGNTDAGHIPVAQIHGKHSKVASIKMLTLI